jgi:hypothetical protein
LNRVVEDFLLMAHPKPVDMLSCSIQDELETIMSLVAKEAREKLITLVLEPHTFPLIIQGDGEKLRQAFLNIIINALQATPPGGKVIISTKISEDQFCVICFKDTGSGINAETLPRIFDPFFTTKQNGTGLGLAITRKIIERHNGNDQFADGGTIFLDELGELLPELQPKLLRALQEKEVKPVGSTKVQKLDVRIVSATNRIIDKAITDGTFREDLYYRLSVIEINLPPLRERRNDIPLLLRYFCIKHCTDKITFEKDALDTLNLYAWPGKVRELENSVERLLIMRNSNEISIADLPDKFREHKKHGSALLKLPDEGYSLEQLEREIVIEALERNSWNQTASARLLSGQKNSLKNLRRITYENYMHPV